MSVATCIKCGGRMAVKWTRHGKDGAVKRLRKCPKCGYKRPTIER
jgi:transcriptional regulator NrdR family protein